MAANDLHISISWLKQEGPDCYLSIVVQAGAKSDAIVGEHDVYLKLRIAAQRVEGQANEHLIEYLAKILNMRKKNIIILKGELGKIKLIKVCDCTVEYLESKLSQARSK